MDGTKNPKDASQVGDTSKGEKGTSEKTPETFTREQVGEVSKKAADDALSGAGRTAADFEKREVAVKAAEDRVAQERKDRNQAELDAVKGDPEARSAIEERHKHRETKSELAKVKQELDTEKEKSKEASAQAVETDRTVKAAEIAAKHDVDLGALIKFTDGSPEAMEELAKALPKKGEAKPSIRLDSGKMIGGEDWHSLSPDEKIRRGTNM